MYIIVISLPEYNSLIRQQGGSKCQLQKGVSKDYSPSARQSREKMLSEVQLRDIPHVEKPRMYTYFTSFQLHLGVELGSESEK